MSASTRSSAERVRGAPIIVLLYIVFGCLHDAGGPRYSSCLLLSHIPVRTIGSPLGEGRLVWDLREHFPFSYVFCEIFYTAYYRHNNPLLFSSRSFIRHGYRDPRYKSLDDDVIYTPYRPTIHHLDTYPEEAYTHSQVNRELYLSSAAIEDSYDISNRSRNRDRDVLAAANQAIVDTELHSSPKAAVASRRVLRGRSVPPTPVAAVHRVHASEVDLGLARASPYILRYPVPPASYEKHEGRYPRVVIIPRFRHTIPVRATRFENVKTAREPSTEFHSEGLRRAPFSLLAYLRNLDTKLKSKRYVHRSTHAPIRSASTKAALLGSKVDVVVPERRRRPKSAYGQASLRRVEARASQAKSDSPQPVPTGGIHAHKPVRLASARPTWRPEIRYRTYRIAA